MLLYRVNVILNILILQLRFSQAKILSTVSPFPDPLEDEEERRRRDRASEKLKQLEIQMAARVSGPATHLIAPSPKEASWAVKPPSVGPWNKVKYFNLIMFTRFLSLMVYLMVTRKTIPYL